MLTAPMPLDEKERLRALERLGILDSAPEREFDALAAIAALVCGVPISLVSLIDHDRQWFKANVGLPGVTETPRDVSFCAHAILDDGVFEVPDALADPRFADNPLVTTAPDIRFYAGATLRLSDGALTVGALQQPPRGAGQPRAGKLVSPVKVLRFNYADPASHTFTLRLDLPDGMSDLLPGVWVKVRIRQGERQALLIPHSALLRQGEFNGVYLKEGEGWALTPVRVGHCEAGLCEVLAGLKGGDTLAPDAWTRQQEVSHE